MPASTATPTPTLTPATAPAVDDNTGYTAEVRFGVVMYGGVSLAVYINGVTNELYEMACATPRVPLGAAPPGSTRELYARLSWLTSNPSLRTAYARALAQRGPGDATDPWPGLPLAGTERSRLVVDVVSGTSAGGINGVFLAKALANGEEFGALEGLWLAEGDIGRLLNDAESYDGLDARAPRQDAHPKSLLNSDRMYLKLLDAMREMRALPTAATGTAESPLVEQMDLFVTTTDIIGAPVALRLFDKVVYERRYKQRFHFQYPNGVVDAQDPGLPRNDFDTSRIPFLAFAARCTSSFPFAFEPMTLARLTELHGDAVVDATALRRWDAYFDALPRAEVDAGAHVWRAFGDGGYLDNKPFSYVVETLAQRYASVPVERKVIYVEPSPERIDPHERPGPTTAPDALTNAVAALTGIPSYEGIREDLQAILQRNRRIERIEKIVRLGEADLENDDKPFRRVMAMKDQVRPWTSLSFKDTVRYYGHAFLPYRRLRLYAVTDRIADRLAERWAIDPASDHPYALRALVRVWRERAFDDDGLQGRQTVNAFLDQFDVDYRVRRLGFLLRKVDEVTRLFRERAPGRSAQLAGGGPSETGDRLLKTVVRHFGGTDPTTTTETRDVAIATLRILKVGLLEARRLLLHEQRQLGARATDSAPANASLGLQLRAVLSLLLGEAPSAGTDGAGPRRSVALDLVAGGSVTLEFDLPALRGASGLQTLQESVVYRAEALLDAAARSGETVLAAALIAGIESMRFKAAETPGAPAGTQAAANVARALLGEPELVQVAVGSATRPRTQVRVQVHAPTVPTGAADGAIDLLKSEVGVHLRELFGEYYLRFDSFDQMSFPLYYDTGTGEPAAVEVVRISPVDATRLIDEAHDSQQRKKLAGTALAHFGAFLDERWRRNDVMWGRLDGAERLITTLLPGNDVDTEAVRGDLIDRAHGRILRAALTRGGQQDLTGLLCEALDELGGERTEARLRGLVEQLNLGTGSQRDRLAGILVSLLSEAGLIDYVRHTRKNSPDPEPTAALRNLSRAVTVAGRLLDDISTRRDLKTPAARWIARAGLVMQGIVAVSLPGTLNQRWFAYAVNVVYAFELVALLFALLFGSSGARSLAATALVVTVALHFLSLVAGDVMREKQRWRRIGVYGAIAVGVLFAGLGGIGLYQVGAVTQLCGPAPASGAADSWACAPFRR